MKKSVVFLSGLLCDDSVWQHAVQNLSANCTCITSTQNSPEKMVATILERAPQEFVLVGHSMGGWLAIEVMKKAKNRVDKLVLINTSARPDSFEKMQRRKSLIQMAQSGRFDEVVELILENFIYKTEITDAVRRMFYNQGSAAFIAQEEAMLARSDCLPILSQIDCPTLVLHAAQDKNFTLEEHQEIASKIAHAKLAIVQDAGHMSPMEQPEEITEHIAKAL